MPIQTKYIGREVISTNLGIGRSTDQIVIYGNLNGDQLDAAAILCKYCRKASDPEIEKTKATVSRRHLLKWSVNT